MPTELHTGIQKYADYYKDNPLIAVMKIWTRWTAVTRPINFALMIDAYYTFNYANWRNVNKQK